MRLERGCLGSLPATTRELLSLRAGLDGPPLSRSAAAAQLGLTRAGAARRERSGLRELHVACGGSAGGGTGGSPSGTAPARLVTLANEAPALQPASSLADGSLGAAADAPRGSQEVKDATESSPPANSSAPVSAAATSGPISRDGAASTTLPLVIAAILAGLAAIALVTLRRRAVASEGGTSASATFTPASPPTVAEPVATTTVAEPVVLPSYTPPAAAEAPIAAEAPAGAEAPIAAEAPATAEAPIAAPPTEAPTPEPLGAPTAARPQPSSGGWAGPSADAGKTAVRPRPQAPASTSRERMVRSASTVAAGAVSFAVRELRRRRAKR